MKKQILLFVLVSLIEIRFVNAQFCPPNPPWCTQGNNIGATEWLGGDNLSTIPLNIKNETSQPIHFYTNAGTGTFNNIKMSILSRTINGLERAGLAIHENAYAVPITFPRSILHLGEDYFTSGIAGWRTWMDVGTFSGLQTDFAFFGIMPFDGDTTYNQQDHNDAVIAWGDNLNGADGADNLRFIFSAPMTQSANDWQTQYSSLEVARFSPWGRMGIGNFTGNAWGGGSGVQPLRRLEIYDESLNMTLTPAPQLRLTFTPDANVNLGINTDFQTTALGNMLITPQNFGAVMNAGIGNFIASGVEPVRRMELLDEGQQLPQLRLTFLQDPNPALGQHADFQSTPRGNLTIVTENNGMIAYTGIGDFLLFGNEPKRRLDIYDQGERSPQLRLTYTADPIISNGIWTDFEALSTGDLIIHPSFQSGAGNPVNGRVGINTITPPANTLEINSNNAYVAGAIGFSGLRFTDMRSGSSSSGNSTTASAGKVLAVDGSGDVILVNDVGGGSEEKITLLENKIAQLTLRLDAIEKLLAMKN